MGEHGPSSSTSPHHLCLLLEVPGTELLSVVHVRTQCKGSYWGDSPLPRGSWDLFLRMPEAIRDGMVREPDILRRTTTGIPGHLSPPRDIPDAALPAGSDMEIGTRDADSPVVMTRRVTPANRPLQHLEAGHLGASTPQHVMSRPAVPDLCIASTNLLSLINPLPMDRLSRQTVDAVCSWPAVDRHHILAVANRDVRVAQQNLAELQLYVDDDAAHIAYSASADDDEIALMSAEILPRLEGGIRAALDEADSL